MSIWKGQKQPCRDGSVFEYCRLTDTVIQAWSVLQHGYFKGNFVGKEEFAALNHVPNDLAKNTKSHRQLSLSLGSFATQVRCRPSLEQPNPACP